jgi:hypothetical protein
MTPASSRLPPHPQPRGRRLLHASRQQGRSAAPARNRDNEATSRSADLGHNRTQAKLPTQPNRTRAIAGGPSQTSNSAAAAGGDREISPHRDPGGGGSDGGSSNHGANRRVTVTLAAEATRTATPPEPHRAALTPARRLKNCGGRSLPP